MKAMAYIFCAVGAFLTLSNAAHAQQMFIPPIKDHQAMVEIRQREILLGKLTSESLTHTYRHPFNVTDVRVQDVGDYLRSMFSDFTGESHVTVRATIDGTIAMTCHAVLSVKMDANRTPDHLTFYRNACRFVAPTGQAVTEESGMFSDSGTPIKLNAG